MSGQKSAKPFSSFKLDADERLRVPAAIRQLAGIGTAGPTDAKLIAAVEAFIQQFEFWYVRVIAEAVPFYRKLIVARINPFVRRMEFIGMDAASTAQRLVDDYARRCYVTAGGWMLERMAIAISPSSHKAIAEGVDIQRLDPTSGAYHLYVLKSSMVTRNSDIVAALKQNMRKAEQLLKQGDSQTQVILNWVVTSGKTNNTFKDSVRRPSSATFWAEMTDLPAEQATDLVLAVAAEAGRIAGKDTALHLIALQMLIGAYIEKPQEANVVDWEFIGRYTMREKGLWAEEDKVRHGKAMGALAATGYVLVKKTRKG